MLSPVIERELRAALRKGNARQGWVLAAWLAAIITFVFLLSFWLRPERETGRMLFVLLIGFGTCAIVVRSLQLTADLFSEERRSGTLGLLFLTGLSTGEIFAGKLLGATLTSAYLLLGALPFLAVPFLVGGVLASVTNRESNQAQMAAVFLLAALCLGTPALYGATKLFSPSTSISERWLMASPAYGPYMVFRGFRVGSPHAFWQNSAITLAYSLGCYWVAGVILHHSWRDQPDAWLKPEWVACWRTRWRGGARRSEALRRELLARNPFTWLAVRDQSLVLTARLFLGGVGAIWCAGLAAWPHHWISTANFFATALVLHLGLMWILLHAAAKRFGEERRSGGMELLLVTPLTAEALVAGQREALLLQFRPVLMVLGGIDLFCMAGGLVLQLGPPLAAVNYVLAWLIMAGLSVMGFVALAGRVMWISLWTGRPAYAVLQAVAPNFWLFIYGSFALGRTIVFEFPKGTWFELALLLLLLGLIAVAAIWTKPIDLKLKREFRLIVAEPIPDAKEPRFKHWRAAMVIPQGLGATRVPPPERMA